MELTILAKDCRKLRLSPPSSDEIAAQLALLLRCSRDWRLVSSAFGEEVHARPHAEHGQWSRRHSHAHPYREVLVPLAGECPFGWRGRVFTCLPGVLFLCEGGESHDLQYPPPPLPLLHLWLTLSPGDCLGSVIWIGERMVPLWRVHLPSSANQIWDRAREEAEPEAARQRIHAALYLVLADIADLARNPEQAAASAREECVRIARRMLDRAHGCGLDLAALARATGYSKFHFHRLFREQTGQTVHQYADQRRRARAAELLARHLSCKEIAFELGFSGPSAFSRWYHQG
jgi:AraC-like DNA-binding protein